MAANIAKSQKLKAEVFLNEANSTLSKRTWFASSTERKYEDAAESYDKAANAYKIGGFHQEAGDAYQKAADIHNTQLKNIGEACKALSNAGSCYSKVSPTDAITVYRGAITLLCDTSRLTQAAKLAKQVAEILEKEIENNESNEAARLAIDSYEQAAELFTLEDAKSQASSCMAKVAELSAAALDPPDLIKAAQIYEDLGKGCLDSNLLKYNAKGYFVQAILCHLANGDAVASSQALSRYMNMDFTFPDSREGKFCSSLVECLENYDTEGFATACFEFDRISKLDGWKTTLLVKAKRCIENEGDMGGLGNMEENGEDVDLT